MTEVEELLNSIVTVDDGLLIISKLENKQPLNINGKKFQSTKNIPAILDEFKLVFYKIQIVSLTLAIEPDRDFLGRLQNWFRENSGEMVVFDLSVDPEIIGGIKLICRNHFRDLSLSSLIEDTTKREFLHEGDGGFRVVPTALI